MRVMVIALNELSSEAGDRNTFITAEIDPSLKRELEEATELLRDVFPLGEAVRTAGDEKVSIAVRSSDEPSTKVLQGIIDDLHKRDIKNIQIAIFKPTGENWQLRVIILHRKQSLRRNVITRIHMDSGLSLQKLVS